MQRAQRGALLSGRTEERSDARSEMQWNLLGSFTSLTLVVGVGLLLRDLLAGAPALDATLTALLGSGGWLLARRRSLALRALGFAFFCALVLLVVKSALDMGGAVGPALSFSFIPGFVAVLVLGPGWGWLIGALMLLGMAFLAHSSPLLLAYDRLRFVDELAMALFMPALSHSLIHAFGVCEKELAKRSGELERLREQRQAMTAAIYGHLEPLAAELVATVPERGAPKAQRDEFVRVMRRLIERLGEAKVLARPDDPPPPRAEDPEQATRRRAMRVWLRIGAALMVFFSVRNWLLHVAFVPSIFSFVFCLGFDAWLARPRSSRSLEWTALAIGLFATGPLAAYVRAYGPTPDAPALVVMPSTVLFTALLSRGPATWLVAAVNVGILAWVGLGQPLSLAHSRLLTDLLFSLLVVGLAVYYVLGLRRRYAQALLEQSLALGEALRQRRKLAGTLFHDVNNHLQVLSLYCEVDDDASEELSSARSLSQRVQRLILLSKEFLLHDAAAPELHAVSLRDTFGLLLEAFAPRLEAKQMQLAAGSGLELLVQAQPELLAESVLGNLVSNAVKFAPPGSAIELFAERSGPEVRIVLRDSGPGLPRELLQRLEHDDVLPSRLGTAGERGQGYGLQLVREHLQRMGGRLELRSRSEGGTDAVVRLQSA
jgi:signal transduction histidine kinase